MGGLSLEVAQWSSLGNTIVRLPLAIVPIFLVERCGRRPLMLITQLLSIVALTSAMICISVGPSAKYGTLVSVSGLLFSTSIGIGCISRFYSAELVPKSPPPGHRNHPLNPGIAAQNRPGFWLLSTR
ncbi:hypothetical protein L596_026517 [Steinernema carpocapsae]|uniref:Major facilitator superfamily (MFS) profile domain-containing protein n=1 Tax=Steinernema carpocapsae TaxID=34508 RepID=A0A4U5M2L2_STECR|nr:hypothetical protein L596_026517 [Steinernema carpocapsae]